MKLQHITDVFFDLDHTLWDFEKNSAVAFQIIFKNHQLPVAVDDFLVVYPTINKRYWELYREDKITHAQLRYSRLKESFNALNVEVEDPLINLIALEYIELLPTSNFLFDDAIKILEYLSKNYTLHIITNGLKDVQTKKIESASISSYFKSITDSESTGHKKPNPIIFNHALQKLDPKNCVMVGDCLDADVRGALAIGMKAIHFDEFYIAKHQESIIINKLAELKNYL